MPRTAIRVVLLVLPDIVIIIIKIQFQSYSAPTPLQYCKKSCTSCTPQYCNHHQDTVPVVFSLNTITIISTKDLLKKDAMEVVLFVHSMLYSSSSPRDILMIKYEYWLNIPPSHQEPPHQDDFHLEIDIPVPALTRRLPSPTWFRSN